jgi:hypothetical protein
MASRIREILDRQAFELAALERREALPLLRVVEQSVRELAADLERLEATGASDTFTAQHLRIMLVQNEEAMKRLRVRGGLALGSNVEQLGELALAHVLKVITKAERRFKDAGGVMEVAMLRRLNELNGTQIHRFAVDRYGADLADRIQRELAAGVARGSTYRELRDRLLYAEDGPLVGSRSRAELIVRMECNAAYNRAHQASLEEAAAVTDWQGTDDPLMKQADESIDKRNHPMSRALHGTVAKLDAPFRVRAAEVEAALQTLNTARKRATHKLKPRRLTGILWRRVGAFYEGDYPAHYNERGRMVPYRRSWEV